MNFFLHVKFVLPNKESAPCYSRNFQARVSFVSPALKLPLLQPAPRLVIPKFGRARELPPHPKSLPHPRHAKSPFYPSARNEAPRHGVKTGGGTLVTYPTFRTSASLSLAPPSPFAPPFVHRGRQNPRNPTLLRRPPDRRPAGDSSLTTSSTATARRPSSTAPDEDPLSISSSRRISRPVLHLQGAALTFASSIAPPESPQRRLDLPHQNRSTLTNSSDEAEANSAPPRRFCTHQTDMVCLHRRRRRRPHHPRRLSPMSLLPRQRLPQRH